MGGVVIQNITFSNTSPTTKTAVALGVFDGIHKGHQDVINCAISYKDTGLSSAVFTFNTKTVTTKGNGHIDMLLSDELKLEMLENMGVDYIFSPEFSVLKNLTAHEFVKEIIHKKLNASVAICGENFRFGKGAFSGSDELSSICRDLGIATIILPHTFSDGKAISSTDIRKHIINGEIALANKKLGYDFYFKLPVVHGNMIGRTLDFPTINQYFQAGQVIPRFGVYASVTEIEGKAYPSISNIGIKPTIGGESFPLAETFIINFKGDLYEKVIKVSLKQFIRPEQKFEDLNELKATIKNDLITAKQILKII